MATSRDVERLNQATVEKMRARRHISANSWHGTAFLVEALLLLAVLTGCIAVFMQLYADASQISTQDAYLSRAVQLASNEAERFAADPAAGDTSHDDLADGGYSFRTKCSVTANETEAGTLYVANITVTRLDENNAEVEPDYSLTTSRYVSAGDANG